MNLGLGELFITCNQCESGQPLYRILENRVISNIYNCQCGNSFTYTEGIINGFCTDHTFSAYGFISNMIDHGIVTIKVGHPLEVKLKKNVPLIHKIFLSHIEKSYYSAPIYNNSSSSFTIISSEIPSRKDDDLRSAKVGEEVQLSWLLYGRTKELAIAPWRQLLVQSKEDFINEKYVLSFLSLAIALESYINSKLSDYLIEKKIDEKGIAIFLKESNMIDKAFVLFKSMLNIDPVEVGKLCKKEYQQIIEKRNKIAHGAIFEISKTEVEEAFRKIVTFIIYTNFPFSSVK